MRDITSGFFIGLGLAMGFVPILIASLLQRRNMIVEMIDRMDGYWKDRDKKNKKNPSNGFFIGTFFTLPLPIFITDKLMLITRQKGKTDKPDSRRSIFDKQKIK